MEIGEVVRRGPVIPVIVLDSEDVAVPLARALVAGGLTVLEVTLRTPAALGGIERIAAEVPGAIVGAGTVVQPADAEAAVKAGARFLVSPGSTPSLLAAFAGIGVAALPGAATASEVLALAELGHRYVKFFPAEAAGGVAYLKSLAGPLPGVRFCPTGGITAESAPGYLALPNVVCVGGSWMLPASLLVHRDWQTITQLASDAAALA